MAGGNQIAKAAGLIMMTMVLSRLLGYVRDVVIYANFGQNRITDAYNAAFSVPDFLYMLLVGGALSSAFIPVFSGYLARDREKDAWEVAGIVLNWVLILLFVGIGAGLMYTPQLINLLVPGFPPESMGLTVHMTRIMFFQVVLMAVSGIVTGILHSYKHFTAPAIGSVLYNLGIIVAGYFLSRLYGITGFALGVVIGALLHLAVQLPVLKRTGINYRFSLDFRHPGVLQLLKLLIPVLIGLSVMQVNLLISQNLASGLPGGMLTALRTGQRLMQLPIGVFAIAISVAFFPTLTEYAARRDLRAFGQGVSLGFRFILFLALPATVGLMVLRVPLIRLLFEVGLFTPENTAATANALLFYSVGICAYASIQLLSRTFYALQDTVTPVVIGILTIGINIVLNLALREPLGHGGLALAYSLAGLFNMGGLFWVLRRKLAGAIKWRVLLPSFGKSLIASLVMGIALHFTASGGEAWFDVATKKGQLLQMSLALAAGMLTYGGVALALKMEEAELVRRLWRSSVVRGVNYS
ncbi:MAG: murein biosynthesis integral membrane protein MurJ [Clostridia bacterium]|nr:murein biosynthesis integral membrane protein MurJ [Clostridia bacterium]